jgi:SAM-dependent methyltransferase
MGRSRKEIRQIVEVPGTDRKTQAMASIVVRNTTRGEILHRILVVGCGDGQEARDLAKIFNAKVDAIDIEDGFAAHHPDVTFTQMDAERLSFPDDTFDLVFSFHALEHIPNPARAISEMRRVLRDGQIFLIGVPNRDRMVAYIGSRNATFAQKIQWNVNDWKKRLKGQFRNELGAHAGFTMREFAALARPIGAAQRATRDYYDWQYPMLQPALLVADLIGLARWGLPCVYLVGRKAEAPKLRAAAE